MSRTLDWASGLFEGEGSFSLNKSGSFLYAVAALNMTDEDSVRRFHQAVGVGTVVGPYDKGVHKPTWLWKVATFEGVQHVVASLWYGLGVRRRTRAVEVLTMATRPYVKMYCKHGHEFTEKNTYTTPQGWRVCRTCNREVQRAYRQRKAA